MSDLRDQLFAEPLWEALGKETGLSNCQMEVVRLMCMGLCTKQIALRTGTSCKTVESHRVHVYDRLGIRGSGEVVCEMMLRAFEKYLENLLQTLEAAYEKARVDLQRSMPQDSNKPGFTPISSSGKKSGLMLAIIPLREAIGKKEIRS